MVKLILKKKKKECDYEDEEIEFDFDEERPLLLSDVLDDFWKPNTDVEVNFSVDEITFVMRTFSDFLPYVNHIVDHYHANDGVLVAVRIYGCPTKRDNQRFCNSCG